MCATSWLVRHVDLTKLNFGLLGKLTTLSHNPSVVETGCLQLLGILEIWNFVDTPGKIDN